MYKNAVALEEQFDISLMNLFFDRGWEVEIKYHL